MLEPLDAPPPTRDLFALPNRWVLALRVPLPGVRLPNLLKAKPRPQVVALRLDRQRGRAKPKVPPRVERPSRQPVFFVLLALDAPFDVKPQLQPAPLTPLHPRPMPTAQKDEKTATVPAI